jgi:hypothetical protein
MNRFVLFSVGKLGPQPVAQNVQHVELLGAVVGDGPSELDEIFIKF